ncbi:MAG: 4-hydroxy-tetrahydrodipicolinate synthase [Mangrovibacterium sp.]
MTKLFEGAGVALVTPFQADNTIDFEALKALVNFQIEGGIDYIVALGTTAETPTLSDEEKDQVVNCIKKEVNGRVPIMLGLGGNNPTAVIDSIHKTDFTGIDGILSVTPFYNKPQQSGLVAYYKAVAEASPVPVILYNVPGRTGVNLSADSAVELGTSCKNIIAIKEASGDLNQVSEIVRDTPDNFTVISGDDALTLPILSVGASGVISVIANVFPKEMARMVQLAKEQKLKEAIELHVKMLQLSRLIFKEGSPAGVKALMNLMGLSSTTCRLPLVEASAELTKELSIELDILKGQLQ